MPAIRQQQFTDMPELVDNQAETSVARNVTGNAQKQLMQSAMQDEQKVAQITNTYRARNVQLGNNIIKEAYESFPDNPTAFNEAVNKGFQKQIKAIPTEDDKLEFMANMEIAKSPYNTRVNTNFDEKMERIQKNTWKDFSRESVVRFSENASMFYTRKEGWQDLLIPLKEAYDNVDELDKNGNYVLSAHERATVKDAWENKGFYGIVGWAGEMFQRTNFNELKKTRDYALKNKGKFMEENGLTEQTYVKTLDALGKYISGKPKGSSTVQGMQKLISLRARKKDMDISSTGVIENPEYYGVDKLGDLMADYTTSFEQGLISKSDYFSDMTTLKQAQYTLIRENAGVSAKTPGIGFFKTVGNIFSPGQPFQGEPKTLEEVGIGYIDALMNPTGKQMSPEQTWATADLYERMYQHLDENGISPQIRQSQIIGKTQEVLGEIAVQYAREVYPLAYQYTDEELKQPNTIALLAGSRLADEQKRNITNFVGEKLGQGLDDLNQQNSDFRSNLSSKYGDIESFNGN